jgi:hypothetical protein
MGHNHAGAMDRERIQSVRQNPALPLIDFSTR